MYLWGFVHLQVDKSPEGQFIQLMALPRTLQQRITKLVDPPGKNRDVEEILLQVAQDPDCGAVVQQGWDIKWMEGCKKVGETGTESEEVDEWKSTYLQMLH